MKKIISICVLLEVFVFNSCTNNVKKEQTSNAANIAIENGLIPAAGAPSMEVKEYVKWIQDIKNGFKKEKTIDDITFSVQYKPYEYIVCQEERKEELRSEERRVGKECR